MSDISEEKLRGASKTIAGQSGDYEIGYRKPPKANRFQPGQSGNPSGRRKARKSLDDSLREALNATTRVMVNGRLMTMTKAEVMWSNLVSLAAKGDVKATKLVIALLKAYPAVAKAPVEPERIHSGMTAREASEAYARMIRGIA
jgi:hypothetical protein